MVIESRSAVAWGWGRGGREGGGTTKGQEETSGGDGYMLIILYGDGFIGISTRQNSSIIHFIYV